MKVIFFGSPPVALPCLKKLISSGHSVELIVTQPDKPSGRGKSLCPSAVKLFAQENGLPILQPEKIRTDGLVLEKIKTVAPDINVVVAYGQIIPAALLYLPHFHSINVHFSLLPKYRGASPVQWAILNGETKTGVTIIRLNEKMDQGDILTQEELEILPEERASSLEARLADLGAGLLLKTISGVQTLRPIPQDHALASYAPKIAKGDGKVAWTAEAGRIGASVRAFFPWPSAFGYLRGKRIKFLSGKPLPQRKHDSPAGTILAIGKSGMEIACGGGTTFLLERLQPEGKREMDAFSFSLGTKIAAGEKWD